MRSDDALTARAVEFHLKPPPEPTYGSARSSWPLNEALNESGYVMASAASIHTE